MTRAEAKAADREIAGRALFESYKAAVEELGDTAWEKMPEGSYLDPRSKEFFRYEVSVAVEALWRAGRLTMSVQQMKAGILAQGMPQPACQMGYPRGQIEEVLLHEVVLIEEFDHFMRGQSQAECQGQRWEHASTGDRLGCSQAHGPVTYGYDLQKFLRGGGGGAWD